MVTRVCPYQGLPLCNDFEGQLTSCSKNTSNILFVSLVTFQFSLSCFGTSKLKSKLLFKYKHLVTINEINKMLIIVVEFVRICAKSSEIHPCVPTLKPLETAQLTWLTIANGIGGFIETEGGEDLGFS